jgi:hypothetical protein
MLTNQPIRSIANDWDRRWISDEYFDLIVWYESEFEIYGFQLCYDKPGNERALTWTRQRGFQHSAIDCGESKPTANRTPILVPDESFPAERVRTEFIARSKLLSTDLRALVLAKIHEFQVHRTSQTS